jgi:ABC-type Fe3+-hydroxamate transport system substrate-binding protein
MIFVDQLQRPISLKETPQRIISLVPSQTELLFDLGLEHEVVGITKFCIHPESWFRTKTRVGGTKQVDLEKVAALKPDLIIANKEENNLDDITWLIERFPVWISDIESLDQAQAMIQSIGKITGKSESAFEINQKINRGFSNIKKPQKALKAVYLIWNNPMMTVSSDTFIFDLMQRIGFEQVSFSSESRYPEISIEAIKQANPECILLSSEPFPFKQKHIAQFELHFPNTSIELVDGEYFSWYGSRLIKAPQYFNKLINQFKLIP